jgi:Arc/MetJ-type ribon-helix-helix transcriptional regulator
MSARIVARVPDDLAVAIDELIEAGVLSSRSEAVRAGLEMVLERERGERADAATAAMIAEEPW